MRQSNEEMMMKKKNMNSDKCQNLCVGDLAEDIAHLRAEGYGVDNDNEPAPENVPQGNNHQVKKTSQYLKSGDPDMHATDAPITIIMRTQQ